MSTYDGHNEQTLLESTRAKRNWKQDSLKSFKTFEVFAIKSRPISSTTSLTYIEDQ